MRDADAALANLVAKTDPAEHLRRRSSIAAYLQSGFGASAPAADRASACPGDATAPRTDQHDPRYPLRLRLWIIVGLAAVGWVALWLGGLALLHAVGLR